MRSVPHASHSKARSAFRPVITGSVLGWPAWLRVMAVAPVVVLLWLALGWAGGLPW